MLFMQMCVCACVCLCVCVCACACASNHSLINVKEGNKLFNRVELKKKLINEY
jgi:hypothetical protein